MDLNKKIIELKIELDLIKEYLNSESCKKCQESQERLEEFEKLIYECYRSIKNPEST